MVEQLNSWDAGLELGSTAALVGACLETAKLIVCSLGTGMATASLMPAVQSSVLDHISS